MKGFFRYCSNKSSQRRQRQQYHHTFIIIVFFSCISLALVTASGLSSKQSNHHNPRSTSSIMRLRSCKNTMSLIDAYLSTIGFDFAEIRIRNCSKMPQVSIVRSDDDDTQQQQQHTAAAEHGGEETCSSMKDETTTILPQVEIREVSTSSGSSGGSGSNNQKHIICHITSLSPATKYDIHIDDVCMLQLETMDDTGLSLDDDATVSNRIERRQEERLLRIGILSDPHVNVTSSYNGKRLYGAARDLFDTYTSKLVTHHKVDCVVLPGDVCDHGTLDELQQVKQILEDNVHAHNIPSYPIIGNHESDLSLFTKILTPNHPEGYYSVDIHVPKNTDKNPSFTENNRNTSQSSGDTSSSNSAATTCIHFIFLATDTQDSVNANTQQFQWLQQDLASITAKHGNNKKNLIIILFLHFSLVIHPLHNNGYWDDGYQLLDNSKQILDLLHTHKRNGYKMAVMAGHKNVPSAIIDSKGLLHTLSPQLIQVPCGYDIIDIYPKALIRITHEIDEMHLQDISRQSAGKQDANNRWGTQEHRSCRYNFD